MADLVIGGRRANPQRRARAAGLLVAMVVVAFVVAWFIYRRAVSYDVPGGGVPDAAISLAEAPGQPPRLAWDGATLSWTGDLAVIRASGDAHTLGAAEGRLLARGVAATVASFAPTLDGAVGGGWTHGMRVAWRYRFVDDGIPDDQQRAIAGVMRGAGRSGVDVDYQDLLRDQASIDIGVPAPWSGENRTHVLARSLTWVSPQADVAGRLWIGRTFALPGLADGGDAAASHPVVTFFKPSGRIAWAGVGWPGLVGAVTGVNAEGLVVTVNPARTGDVRPTRTARPVALLARQVLETCTSIDEAVKLIDATPTLGAAAFVVADGKTGHWAVLQRSPSRLVVVRDPPTPAVGDLLSAAAFSDDLDNDRARRTLATGARVARAAHLLRTPPADAAAAVAVLRDRAGSGDRVLPEGHRGAIADPAAVHVVLIDPGAMAMWVADGGARGTFRGFDLRYELRGEGNRAGPPPDVPAEAPEPGAAGRLVDDAALRTARADLRQARRALADDEPDRAEELVDRALVRAPALPQALELITEIARAHGDGAAERKAAERWLNNGADDPGAEEEVRARLGL